MNSKVKCFWLVLLLLASCTSKTLWNLPSGNGTEEQFAKVDYECDRDTRMAEGSFRRERKEAQTGYQTYGNTITPYRQPDPWGGLYNLGASLGEGADRADFYKRCMKSKGWVEVNEHGDPIE